MLSIADFADNSPECKVCVILNSEVQLRCYIAEVFAYNNLVSCAWRTGGMAMKRID